MEDIADVPSYNTGCYVAKGKVEPELAIRVAEHVALRFAVGGEGRD